MSNESIRTEGDAHRAGRGVLYIAFAKLYFMLAGAVIEFRLPAILTNTVFGAYAVVASTVSPLNNVLITGSIQAVSRFTAQTPERAEAIKAAGFRMHLWIGLPVAALFIAAAPVFSYFFHDSSKTGPLMLAGLIVVGYSFYAVLVGSVNGLKWFGKQAGLDICFATARAVGILGLAMLGFGLYGAIGGWVAAVGVILVVASFVVGLPARGGERFEVKPLVGFFASVALYLVLLNLIMFVDQLLLKRLAAEWFMETRTLAMSGLAESMPSWAYGLVSEGLEPAKAADTQVGFYRAVQNLARLSYQAIIAATFVVFPLVSSSTFVSDADATKRYITTTTRYSLIFASAIAVVFVANPTPMLDIPYPSDYAFFGGPALALLAIGNVAFSLFVIVGTILNGAGRVREAIVVAGITLTIAAVANAIVIPRFPPGRDLLAACAAATGSAMIIGTVVGGYFLRKHFDAFVPLLTVIRVLIAGGIAVALSRFIPFETPLLTLVEATIVGLTFLFTLIVTRELSGKDLRGLLSVVRRKKEPAS